MISGGRRRVGVRRASSAPSGTVRLADGPAFAPLAGMTAEGLRSPMLAVALLPILTRQFAFGAVLLRFA